VDLEAMYTYQKVMIGLAILSFAVPVIAAAFGVSIRPLDEIGGGGPR
jgi:hypothetical protein